MSVETRPLNTTSTTPTRGSGRWIVGVDGSECSRHAALWAAAHATGRMVELQLVSAWTLPMVAPMSPMSPTMAAASIDGLEESACAAVDDVARHICATLDLPVARCVAQGGATALLLDAAHDSELLVVGSRGRGGFARLLLGSTSTQCATHSNTPVAVIPSAAEIRPIASIMVAFDGSRHSIAALTWAIRWAPPGTTIECVSVWDTSPIAVGSDRFFFPEASNLARERADHLVARTVQAVDRDDVSVHHDFVEGRPRPVLSDRAAGSDLIVMGARGNGAIGAAMLGSVSSWLLHHLEHAMVVVRSPNGDPDEGDHERNGEED